MINIITVEKINEGLFRDTYGKPCIAWHTIEHQTDRVMLNRMHVHDCYEIHYTLTDNTVYKVDGRTYTANKGSVSVFNKNEIHGIFPPVGTNFERYVLLFNHNFIHDITALYPEILDIFHNRYLGFVNCLPLTTAQHEELGYLMNKTVKLYISHQTRMTELACKLTICEILRFLREVFLSYDENIYPINYASLDKIKSIMDYIKNNLSNDLQIETLSKKFFVSKTNLRVSFMKSLGMTPKQYITFCRIMKARELLTEGKPVFTVSEKVGYCDESNFIRTFKNLVGTTPKEYSLR